MTEEQPIIFDTHAHYDDESFDADLDQTLRECRDAGVRYIMNAGTSVPEIQKAQGIVARAAGDASVPDMYFSAGIHPHFAGEYSTDRVGELAPFFTDPRCCAVGEIGLDFHYEDGSPRNAQQDIFYAQLCMARQLGRPVMIHERDAFDETYAVLSRQEFSGVPVLIHCFSHMVAEAKKYLDLGFSLSFTGAVTYKNGGYTLEAACYVPIDRLMIETDCPYLAPVPKRGKRNCSAYLVHTAQTIAEGRGMPYTELCRRTAENGLRFYSIDARV
ncbi:MAG: TatD family hydrolase [Oscillospiraceae bacterium]|jgi:TatD DNase family protein|nr:TatD family hydrolase [Oscillospiraceae bacterium]